MKKANKLQRKGLSCNYSNNFFLIFLPPDSVMFETLDLLHLRLSIYRVLHKIFFETVLL